MVWLAAIFISPATFPLKRVRMCDASEVAFNACFAAGKNCSPISDKISARPFLLNSFAWFNRSSFASALDAADCVIPSFLQPWLGCLFLQWQRIFLTGYMSSSIHQQNRLKISKQLVGLISGDKRF